MTYELALKLKKAGFEQKIQGNVICSLNHKTHNEFIACENEHPYSPTLSELIEACGDRFGGLVHYDKEGENKTWVAFEKKEYHGKPQSICMYLTVDFGLLIDTTFEPFEGETPEEAIANLWLELNKK